MNAKEARMFSEKHLSGPVIQPLLDVAYSRIHERAKEGFFSLMRPFHGAKPWPALEIRKAAIEHLRSEGYTVEHMLNPDPDDPRSSDYDVVTW